MRAHNTLDVQLTTLTIHFGAGGGHLVLLDGSATIFRAALMRNVRYTFGKSGVPVMVQESARFDVEGDFSVRRGILDTAVDDIHAILEAARAGAVNAVSARQAKQLEEQTGGAVAPEEEVYSGPRVIVVGDQNTGKSALCRSLVNAAVSKQNGRNYGVAFIDVDVGQQSISVPGSVAAVFVEAPVPVDEGFNTMMPLSFFFGDKQVNPTTRKRYLDLCACSAQACAAVGYAKPPYECGGMVINTMGWTRDLGRDLLLELLSIFAVTHVVVTGSDLDLETAMRNAVLGRPVEVVRYPTQEGIPRRVGASLSDARVAQLVSYFSGTARTPLSPNRSVANAVDLVFLNALSLNRMTPKDIPPCCVAAVVWAENEETAGEANVAGYVILIDMSATYFSFLSPAPGPIPKPYLLVSPTLILPSSKIPPVSV